MILDQFEQRVNKMPDSPAIVTEETSYSYNDLHLISNQIADRLSTARTDIVNSQMRAVLLFEHGAEMILAMLACIKAGVTYVPIDSAYPFSRAAYITDHAEPQYIITNNQNEEKALQLLQTLHNPIPIVNVNELQNIDDHRDSYPIAAENAAAYILYTSGSTGEPKGVVQTYKHMLFYINNYIHAVNITSEDRLTLFSSYIHDASIMDIFGALLAGATLYPKDIRHMTNDNTLSKWLLKNQITVWHSVPTLYRYFIKELAENIALPQLRLVVLGGEAVIAYDAESLFEKIPNAQLYSLYGQTESSFNSGISVSVNNIQNSPLLGTPIPGLDLILLNEAEQKVEPGETGEIHVSSNYISTGYWKDPTRTQVGFKNHILYGKLYATGDLGCLLDNGDIQFMGRKDFQVKIRGYRVETGEVESVLLRCPKISKAVVVSTPLSHNESLQHHLYAVLQGENISGEEARAFLARYLPEYMLPSRWLVTEQIPTTATGKTDRKKILELFADYHASPSNEVATTQEEQLLSTIWCNIFKVEQVRIQDDFYYLGGDSLSGLRMASEIYKTFNVKIKLADIFANHTIQKMADFICSSNMNGIVKRENAITVFERNENNDYPVSSMQKKLIALQLNHPNSVVYNESKAYRITDGRMEPDRLAEVVKKLVNRHESLRTSFVINDTEFRQQINPFVANADSVFTYIPYIANDDPSAEATAIRIKSLITPFDLRKAPLIRVILLEENDHQILIIDIHHIVADGLSLSILIRDLLAIYEERESGALSLSYLDYVLWNEKNEDKERKKELEAFWNKELGPSIPRLNLPIDESRRTAASFAEGGKYFFDLDYSLSENIACFVKEKASTDYAFLLSVFSVVLSKYSGQQDFVIGTPVLGRGHSDLENSVGMFVNSIALRVKPDDNFGFREFMDHTKNRTIEALEYQDYDFGEMAHRLDMQTEYRNHPLFDVFFSVQNFNTDIWSGQNFVMKELPIDNGTSKFDLTFIIGRYESELRGFIEYNKELYSEEFIKSLMEHFIQVLRIVLDEVNIPIAQICLLNEQEKNRILHAFNNTQKWYPQNSTISELFEKAVKDSETLPALIAGSSHCSYGELNEKSNQIAWSLRKKGIGQGDIVPIICDTDINSIISMVGVLKAGAAYLPIDKHYPVSRIQYVIEDSRAALVIGDQIWALGVGLNIKSVEIMDITAPEVSLASIKNMESSHTSGDTAYVIYTSGTTGNPKGVCISHRSLAKMVINNNFIKISSGHSLMQAGSLSFDASVQQIWLALLHTVPLHLISKQTLLDTDELAAYMRRQQITHLVLPTTFFNQFSQAQPEAFEKVKCIIAGGDVISSRQVNHLLEKFPKLEIINGYGPTENTVISTSFHMKGSWDEQQSIPIGKPVSNSTAYVMDHNHQLLPIGIPGELLLGGDGLASGYWNKPELTAEKFIAHPYMDGERLYKTGDMVRWLPDGNLEFLGRIDRQVKIRGYRVEIAEIEKRLGNLKGVKEAVVVAVPDASGDNALYGYIVEHNDSQLSISDLRTKLEQELPEYMIPTHMQLLDRLPLTPNGKIDTRALPKPEFHSIAKDYVSPETNTERTIADVWQEILGRDKIGVTDSFFNTGGDSIKAIQIVSRLRQHHIKISVKDIMQQKTIKKIALQASIQKSNISQAAVEGSICWTPVLKEFINNNSQAAFKQFNQSYMFHSAHNLDKVAVEQALKALVIHHDALRLAILPQHDLTDGLNASSTLRLYNRSVSVKEHVLFKVDYFDLSNTVHIEQEIIKEADKLQADTDPYNGAMLRAGIFRTNAGDYLLLIIHHVAVDGVSWRILLEDFKVSYRNAQLGKEEDLPARTASFQNWAAYLNQYAQSAKLHTETRYWKSVVKQIKEIQQPKTTTRQKDLASLIMTLDEQTTLSLLTDSHKPYGTEVNDLLLAALGRAYHMWTGQDKMSLILEGHGREELGWNEIQPLEINRTVGWFTSVYPVVLNIGDKEPAMIIKQTKETLRRIPNKGIGYGIIRYLTDYANQKEYEVNVPISFNYMGQFDQEDQENWLSHCDFAKGTEFHPEMTFGQNIQINGKVQQGRLKLMLEYNRNIYTDEIIAEFCTMLKQSFEQIVYCTTHTDIVERTPSDYGINEYSIEEHAEIMREVVALHGESTEVESIHFLTPMQEGIFYTYLKNNATTAYVIQTPIQLSGTINHSLLEKSFSILLDRHAVLRTMFLDHWKHSCQIVLKRPAATISFACFMDCLDQEEKLTSYKQKCIEKGFELRTDLLMNLHLIRLQETKYILLINVHHIIMDGWSIALIMNELLSIYDKLSNDQAVYLSEVPDYREYLGWLHRQDTSAGIAYWESYLQGYHTPARLLPDLDSEEDYEDGLWSQSLGEELSRKIQQLAWDHEITVNTVCQTVWAILLQKYNKSSDVVFGTVISGRPAEVSGIESMIGMMINAVPIRIVCQESSTLDEMLKSVQQQANMSQTYNYVSLAEIQKNSVLKQDLIHHLTVFENYPDATNDKQFSQFHFQRETSREQTGYDLGIAFSMNEQLVLDIMYNKNKYSYLYIQKIATHLEMIFKQFAQDTSLPAKEISLLDEMEKKQLQQEMDAGKKLLEQNESFEFNF
ncbi:non-ribosomal peptide synthetase [Paenibacillus dauci]|uniref:non-ribosomal peptide synthetase n=1 Tax=Paenibacillus dauci TaxID=1567106 RepID=UPI00061995BD|nr:non-ribosomal peptide synthetase [Paenibacillus dauci]